MLLRSNTNLQSTSVQRVHFQITTNSIAIHAKSDPLTAAVRLQSTIESWSPLNGGNDSIETKNGLPNVDFDNRAQLADLENNLAIALSQTDRPEFALQVARSAVDFWQNAFQTFPNHRRTSMGFATALNTLGEVNWRLNQHNQCDRCFEQAIDILQQVTSNQPNSAEANSRLATTWHNRGLVAFQANQFDEARDHIKRALHFQQISRNLAPNHAEYQTRLIAHQEVMKWLASHDDLANIDTELPFQATSLTQDDTTHF